MSFSQICNRTPAISAVQDFNEGVACGRRDSRSPQNPSVLIDIYLSILSRTYYKSPTTKGNVTNPGEFPWVAAIFDKSEQDPYRCLYMSKYLNIYTIYAI